MSAADYWLCPICGKKALYDDVDRPDDAPAIDVVHTACLEKDRANREKALREQIVHDLTACRKCGKPHVYRELPPNGDWLRGTWGDPDDGHAYCPRVNYGTGAAEAVAIVCGEVSE